MNPIKQVILLITQHKLYHLARPQIKELLVSEGCPSDELDNNVEKIFNYFKFEKKVA